MHVKITEWGGGGGWSRDLRLRFLVFMCPRCLLVSNPVIGLHILSAESEKRVTFSTFEHTIHVVDAIVARSNLYLSFQRLQIVFF